MGQEYKVGIIEEHALLRDAISAYVESASGLSVCFATSQCSRVLGLVQQHEPDLLLLNATSTSAGGLLLLRVIRHQHPDIKVAAYARDQHEFAYVERLAVLGLEAFFCKTDNGAVLIRELRRVLSGARYFCGDKSGAEEQEQRLEKLARQFVDPVDTLSDRESEVFYHIGWGYPCSDIADRLLVSRKTVATYVRRIKQKLEMRDTPHLCQYAIAHLHCGGASRAGNAPPTRHIRSGSQTLCGAPECCCTMVARCRKPRR